MKLAAAFIRVSTGSQDETSQIRDIEQYAADNGITLVKPHKFVLHGYSASAGEQEPALLQAIADIERGEYATLIVTEFSRLDRRTPKQQKATLLAIGLAGGRVLSISEPDFGKDDTLSGDVLTLIAQHMNYAKSKTVEYETYRGVSIVIANNAFYGQLPPFWDTRGDKYMRQAYCANPEKVVEIYERVANRESLSSIGRKYVGRRGKSPYVTSVKALVRFAANHTGIIECSYRYNGGEAERWPHEVIPVVDSALWWRANRVLDENLTDERRHKGGRPVAQPSNWISGVLACPECGGKLFVNLGPTPAGTASA